MKFSMFFCLYFTTSISASALNVSNLKLGCEGKEDGQLIEVFQGHVIRIEDGGAEAEYYRVTELNKMGLKGELTFTGLRTNDSTAVTSSSKGLKTIDLQRAKPKFWKVTTKQIVAKKPYVLTHECKEEQ